MEDPRRGRGKILRRAGLERFGNSRTSARPSGGNPLRARASGHLVDALFCASLAGQALTQRITRRERTEFVALMQGEVDRALSWGQALREMDRRVCPEGREGRCLAHARTTLEAVVNALGDLRHPARYALTRRRSGWRVQATASFSSLDERTLQTMITGTPRGHLQALALEPTAWKLAALAQELRERGGGAGLSQTPLGRTRLWLDLPPGVGPARKFLSQRRGP